MNQWMSVPGYEGKYLVSPLGEIASVFKTKTREVKGYNFHGYRRVKLRKNGKVKSLLVHRIVAAAFLDKPRGKDFVNHIDGTRSNNSVTNLEWCTPKENSVHAHSTGLVGCKIGKSAKRKHGSSRFKGVRVRNGKVVVQFQFNFKKYFKSGFSSEQEAFDYYQKWHSSMVLNHETRGV